MDATRGFSALQGETVLSIDTSAINVAVITTRSGHTITIETQGGPYGIPVVVATNETTK